MQSVHEKSEQKVHWKVNNESFRDETKTVIYIPKCKYQKVNF